MVPQGRILFTGEQSERQELMLDPPASLPGGVWKILENFGISLFYFAELGIMIDISVEI